MRVLAHWSGIIWPAGPNIEFPESQTWTAGSFSCGRSQLGEREASVVVMDKLIFLSLLPATKSTLNPCYIEQSCF